MKVFSMLKAAIFQESTKANLTYRARLAGASPAVAEWRGRTAATALKTGDMTSRDANLFVQQRPAQRPVQVRVTVINRPPPFALG
jgi:hypothetical protein